MKKRISEILLIAGILVGAYLIGAFVVTPPYSSRGIYAVPGCPCGHHAFATTDAGELFLYTAVHNVRHSLGNLTEKDGVFTASAEGVASLTLKFTFWGCLATNSENSTDFYPRDFLYPIALFTRFQTEKSQQADPANRHPFGTSGTPPANPASRAGGMPEASGDS